MPAERLSMRKIREVLRLSVGGKLSPQVVSQSCGIGRTTVREYLQRARRAGLSWPLPEGLTDEALEAAMFPAPGPADAPRPLPDWGAVRRERQRKGVTLFLLWEEYKAAHPGGYEYSRFCDLYREWAGKLPVWMRQDHKAGEELYVDYAGMTAPLTNRETGEVRAAQIFVATLGASHYTYAEATLTQTLPDFLASHVRALEFLGGAPRLVIPDNLRSAVSRTSRYDPDLNPSYAEWAAFYGTAVLPARVRRPKDKSPVESAVNGVERRILARLRNRKFFSLEELNQAISPLLAEYNLRPFQQLGGSRRSVFLEVDKPALKPLPRARYEYAEWVRARVSLDYHVCAGEHYYSVPHRLVKERVDVRMTATVVEIFHNGQRVASHFRARHRHRHTTRHEHMPAAHREHAEWTPERVIRWVGQSGEAAAEVVRRVIDSYPVPEQGYRACMGLKRLGETCGADRLEAACRRALAIESPSYKTVKSILEGGLDKKPLPDIPVETAPIRHENVRGAEYYRKT